MYLLGDVQSDADETISSDASTMLLQKGARPLQFLELTTSKPKGGWPVSRP